MMPGMDGFEVMAWLRAHPECGDIPVIVLTAKDLADSDVARLGEARRLLRKGEVSDVLLVDNLREVLERVPARA
ncbi:response regulator PleD [compost metagenome]